MLLFFLEPPTLGLLACFFDTIFQGRLKQMLIKINTQRPELADVSNILYAVCEMAGVEGVSACQPSLAAGQKTLTGIMLVSGSCQMLECRIREVQSCTIKALLSGMLGTCKVLDRQFTS